MSSRIEDGKMLESVKLRVNIVGFRIGEGNGHGGDVDLSRSNDKLN